ncbi:MAG: hypothetical protein DRJ42_26275 [Deltaproteobacteria bacterium]|nr:MAG: hypothetical protein DRJ42_26275 [Deltaproteobacteria bacterium]
MLHYSITTSFSLALILSIAPLAGCGDDSTTATCEAGRQIPCACGGGEEGFQRCRDDGSGYDGCQCDGVDAGGDTGTGDAGADSGMTDSGSDSAAGDSSVDSSSDAGAVMCDDGALSYLGSSECSACTLCSIAAGKQCFEEADACNTNADCGTFLACLAGCSDEVCKDACVASHPSGAPLAQAATLCTKCVACPNNCGASANPTCAP